jgi:hypothetical protein
MLDVLYSGSNTIALKWIMVDVPSYDGAAYRLPYGPTTVFVHLGDAEYVCPDVALG